MSARAVGLAVERVEIGGLRRTFSDPSGSTVTLGGMKPQSNATDVDDATAQRHARRLAALEVQVAELDRARRRSLALGPILLLGLANTTPLVIVNHKDDPDETYTLFQVVSGAVKALPVGWFLLIGVAGLLCVGAAVTVGRSAGRSVDTWPIVACAATLLVALVAALLAGSAAGTRDTTYLLLTPAAGLGAAAAIWLIVGAGSLRR